MAKGNEIAAAVVAVEAAFDEWLKTQKGPGLREAFWAGFASGHHDCREWVEDALKGCANADEAAEK